MEIETIMWISTFFVLTISFIHLTKIFNENHRKNKEEFINEWNK